MIDASKMLVFIVVERIILRSAMDLLCSENETI